MKRQMKIASSRVPKKGKECFDKPVLSKAEGPSLNGKFSALSILSPFVPSINSGQTFYDTCQAPIYFFYGCWRIACRAILAR